MNKEDPQILIADLCERFTKIFEEIKDIKSSRETLELENSELSILIEDEIQKHQASIEQLQNELLELQKINEKETQYFDTNPVIEREITKLISEIENQQMMVELLEKKRHDISEKTGIMKGNRTEIQAYTEKLSNDLENRKLQLNTVKSASESLEKRIQEIEHNILEGKKKYEILQMEFAQNERVLQESLEERMRREDEQKIISQEYRDLLKKNTNCAKNVQECEKQVQRVSEELKVKIQRLEVLLKLNAKMSSKLLKLEEESLNYENLLKSNKTLQHNVQVLQEKIEILTQQPISPDYKVQIKKLLLEMSHKTKNLSPNFVKLKNFVKLNQNSEKKKSNEEDDLEDIIKQNIYMEEYIKTLEKTMAQQNNEIFDNSKTIREEEAKLREIKEVAFSNKIDKENIEKKFEKMKERMQNYSKKLNFSGE